jgi:tetratricopeptide (TPR) repeat protein
MNRLLLIPLFLLLQVLSSQGQTILMKDGKVIDAKAIRRQGDAILATIEIAPQQPGQNPTLGEFGYPVANIWKINFPEPEILTSAATLINAGDAAGALRQMGDALTYYDTIGDVPGSWWAECNILAQQAHIELAQYDQAEAITVQMIHSATNPDSIAAANVFLAAAIARKGDYSKALTIYEQAIAQAHKPQTLAAAALYEGQSLLADDQWEAALLKLLEVPVFYPNQRAFLPAVLLGSARAYTGLHDFDRANASLQQLTKDYPHTPEAAQVDAERQKIARLQEAIASE